MFALPVLLLATLSTVSAFDCKLTLPSLDRSKPDEVFDLNPLSGQRSASKETDTPPTKNEAVVKMQLCGDDGVEKDDKLSEEDQCPTNTKVCLTLLNHKPSSTEADRVTAVIPIWPADLASENIKTNVLENNEGLEISVMGNEYAGTKQSMSLKLLCSPMATDPEPSFESYTNGLLTLQWSTPAACPRSADDGEEPSPDGSGKDSGNQGRGFLGLIALLFWLSILGLACYFLIGMYFNYTTYGARGKDLLPHRDFWLELPNMLSDLLSHLVAGLRGRHGSGSGSGARGGYTAI